MPWPRPAIAVDTVRAETGDGDAIELVRFVLFSQPLLSAFDAALTD